MSHRLVSYPLCLLPSNRNCLIFTKVDFAEVHALAGQEFCVMAFTVSVVVS